MKKKLFIIWFFGFQLYAQNTTIENLVFEGAGIRGIAYSGVIKTLENYQLTDSIHNVAGTSAGAITAMMLALGYTSDEIYRIIDNTNFQHFNDGELIFMGGFYRLINQYGWYKGDRLSMWLENLIDAKTGNPDITFQQLQSLGYKNLFVTGTCLNKQKLLVFSAQTYPDMKIKDAVRISISIPLYFKAVFIDEKGQVYDKQNKEKNLDLVVDGGIIGNFPIFIFDDYKKDENGRLIRIPNPKTLGIRIDTDKQIQNDQKKKELTTIPIKNINDYMLAFYTLVLEKLNRAELTQADWQRTISVSSVGVGPKIKKLTQEQKKKLMKSGEKATRNFLYKNKILDK